MRALLFAAGSAAALVGLGVSPGLSADMTPPAPIAEYDEPEFVEPVVEGPPVIVEPGPAAPVIGPPAYVFGGYNYCWFEGGWRGAGWYVCDYGPWVTGSWWGGPAGWNGWAWRGGPRFYDEPYGRPPARVGRPYVPPRGRYDRHYARPRAVFDRGAPPMQAGYGPRANYARGGYGGHPYGGRGHWGGGGGWSGGGGYR